MSLFQLSEVKALLKQLDHYPRKVLSQNFLVDGNVLQKIMRTASIEPGDKVLEIGPGLGALTEALLNGECLVTAVEKDHNLSKHIKAHFDNNRLTLLEDDFLNLDLEKVFKSDDLSKKVKVVANIPYKITGIIIKTLIQLPHLFSCIVLMVQKEFAERMVAKCGDKNYSSFTLLTQVFSEAKIAFTVAPSCFHPQPSVDSVVIKLIPKQMNPDIDTAHLLQIIHLSFAQRRKKFTTSLKNHFLKEDLIKALEDENINLNARPQELTLDQFTALSKRLRPSSTQ
ncbi:ribosomal RNA small subunit methyltransferase A [Candidatus Aerophobetes bacterium]|uniref:Ribosomal RNA small subunit methyltransferase A n=1 Tax=Aerophobetes bacterium TaxID=2030807 RepID=A0A2A4X6S6_UNCAE|nr:MAG: ribosomal RNA small subunit methyltransferase A [Candidatus Aerophobetes bacterium]